MTNEMTSMERTLTALSHKEPDRTPLFLLLTLHGAREKGLPIKEYFSKAEYVADGQLRMLKKYGGDCLYPFFYAPVEIEASGGEVIYVEDGPPNSGEPIISDPEDIKRHIPPRVSGTPCLMKVLDTIKMLKSAVGGSVPIIGVAMSPFSLPVMQMGFEKYIDVITSRPDLFSELMAKNEEFTVEWANMQIEAGATAICYFDPVSSPTIVPRKTYLETGFKVAQRTLPRINGATATHFASGICKAIIDDVIATGTNVVGTSAKESLAALKTQCSGKITILGNLNGVEMRRWSSEDAERNVKEAIRQAGEGGGFILSDNHGEIPFQTPDEVILAIADSAKKWGAYPLKLNND